MDTRDESAGWRNVAARPSGRSLNPELEDLFTAVPRRCCGTKPIFSRYFSALVNKDK